MNPHAPPLFTDSVIAALLDRPVRPLCHDLAFEFKDLWKQGERVGAEVFLARYPELAEDASIVRELAYEEYVLRTRMGESTDVEAFCARFPDICDDLQQVIACHQLLEECAASLPDEASEGWPRRGQEFLDFQIVRELGRGGFARVYLARQPSLGGRRVALKVSREGGPEAETLGRLSHPNIVPVYSVRHDPNSGLTAVCMPYLGRSTLADVIDRVFSSGTLPTRARVILDSVQQTTPAEELPADPYPMPDRLRRGPYLEGVLRLAVQLAEALAFIHGRGVLHGDLKPSNVLMTPSARPMLLDFNLAWDARRGTPRVGGTIRYMAPEQLRALADKAAGRRQVIDARSDLFALGVILYELATGVPPFGLVAAGLSEEQACGQFLERQRAGAHCVREANPHIERSVARLIAHCLAFEPKDRPASAAKLVAAFRACLSPTKRLRRRLAQHALALLLGLGLLVAAGSACGYSLLTREPYALRELHRGQEARQAGRYEEAIEHLTRSIEADPANWQALFARGRARQQIAMQRPATQRVALLSLALSDYHAAVSQENDGRIWAAMGYCACSLKQFDKAIEDYKQAIEAGWAPAELFNNLGLSYIKLGQPGQLEEAIGYLDKAIILNPRLQAPYHNRATLRSILINLGIQTPQPNLMLEDIERAVQYGPGSAELYFDAACLFASRAGRDREHAERALTYLQMAVEQGLEPGPLAEDPLLRELCRFPQFRSVVERPPACTSASMAVRLLDPIADSAD
jgi:serine/threonine protein kinase/Tfp pilus assembly protein PilF